MTQRWIDQADVYLVATADDAGVAGRESRATNTDVAADRRCATRLPGAARATCGAATTYAVIASGSSAADRGVSFGRGRLATARDQRKKTKSVQEY